MFLRQSFSNSFSSKASNYLCLSIWPPPDSFLYYAGPFGSETEFSSSISSLTSMIAAWCSEKTSSDGSATMQINIPFGHAVRFFECYKTGIGTGMYGRASITPETGWTITVYNNLGVAPWEWVRYFWSWLMQTLMHSAVLRRPSRLLPVMPFPDCPVGLQQHSLRPNCPWLQPRVRCERKFWNNCDWVRPDAEDASFHEYILEKPVEERCSD